MIVKAKRSGWDEQLTDEQYMDMEPTSESHPDGADLEGELEVIEYERKGKKLKLHLVGGQEADPDTIEEV